MAVTNLTGYTWVGNDWVEPSWGDSDETFYIDFISNSTDFTQLDLEVYDNFLLSIYYRSDNLNDTTQAYNPASMGWTNSNLKTIIINGGTDVTNSTLISRLEEIGTLTPPPPPPPSISDKLLAVNQVKQDIKVAIENKGVALAGVGFGGYAGKIDELPAVVELTQAQYDALSVYDNNTYYLIVEV